MDSDWMPQVPDYPPCMELVPEIDGRFPYPTGTQYCYKTGPHTTHAAHGYGTHIQWKHENKRDHHGL
jgi:hypothetical protein